MSKFFIPFWHIINGITFRRPFRIYFKNSFIKTNLKSHYGTTKSQITKIFTVFLKPFAISATLPLHKLPGSFVKNNSYDFEKQISDIVVKAEELMIKGRYEEAKRALQEALRLCDEKQMYGNISAVYELLAAIAYNEGAIIEAENIIVEFIEKLIQLGYPETHNSIVRFKLKLARLYQAVNYNEMAELGYKECIRVQEEKIDKTDNSLDENSNTLYCNALFWYARLMDEIGEYNRAKIFYKKTHDRLEYSKTITTPQKMVVLYFLADVLTKLKDFDAALSYLYKGLELGSNEEPFNPDTPYFVIKIGLLHLERGLFENARYWCQAAAILASDQEALCIEAENCLDLITKLENENEKIRKESKDKSKI